MSRIFKCVRCTESFTLNSAGQALMGMVHQSLGLPTAWGIPPEREAKPPFQATDLQCRAMIEAIDALPDVGELVEPATSTPAARKLHRMAMAEIITWFFAWRRFIAHCAEHEGYESE